MRTQNPETRTAFISTAIEEFLNFAEQADIAKLNLCALVEQVDSIGSAAPFREQF